RVLESLAESSPASLFLPASSARDEKRREKREERRERRAESSEGAHGVTRPTSPLSALRSPLSRPGARKSRVLAGSGKTQIFIYPPYHFKIADALLTNFHLPRS